MKNKSGSINGICDRTSFSVCKSFGFTDVKHYYKGPSGIIDSGVAGLILGTAYMLSGRNLWASIFTHGFIDTFGLIEAFFGWSK